MNELSGGSDTTTATGSETGGRWESTDGTGRHAAAGDGFQSEDEALEALLAREDRALEKAQGKEDRDLDAVLAEEDQELDAFMAEGDQELDAFLAEEDRELGAFLAEEDRELDALLAQEDRLLEPSQRQHAPGGTAGDNPGLDDEAGLGAEPDGDSGTLTAEGQDIRDGEERVLDSEGDQVQPTVDPVLPPDSSPDDPSAEAPGTTGNPGSAGSELAATDADIEEGPGAEPEKILFEGKQEKITYEDADLEVTHDAADGIWIEGMPGDPPLRIGEVLSGAEEGEHSRLKGLSELATKRAEDFVDTGEKLADLINKQFSSPPPTHTGTLHQVPDNSAGGSEHGIDVGHSFDAVLALAVVGAAGVYKLRQWWGGGTAK